MGSLGKRMGEQAAKATVSASLSYDAHSWLTTLRLLDVRGELVEQNEPRGATVQEQPSECEELSLARREVDAAGLGVVLGVLSAEKRRVDSVRQRAHARLEPGEAERLP